MRLYDMVEPVTVLGTLNELEKDIEHVLVEVRHADPDKVTENWLSQAARHVKSAKTCVKKANLQQCQSTTNSGSNVVRLTP